jgi:DNA-binding XRE family transcriptional regulator
MVIEKYQKIKKHETERGEFSKLLAELANSSRQKQIEYEKGKLEEIELAHHIIDEFKRHIEDSELEDAVKEDYRNDITKNLIPSMPRPTEETSNWYYWVTAKYERFQYTEKEKSEEKKAKKEAYIKEEH